MSKYRFIDEDKAHVHTLNGRPLYGTSTIVGILNKPLLWWSSGMAVGTMGWTATKSDPQMRLEVATAALEGIKQLEPKAYLRRLDLAYKAHAVKKDDAAVAGTDMHAELEKYVKFCIEAGGSPQEVTEAPIAVLRFSRWAIEYVEEFLFSEAHTYSERMWVGGIVDCVAKMKSETLAVMDFKSSKEAYYSQFVQIGGYCIQLEETGVVTSEGVFVYEPLHLTEMIVVPFGSEMLTPRRIENVPGFKKAFEGALINYQMSKAYEDS